MGRQRIISIHWGEEADRGSRINQDGFHHCDLLLNLTFLHVSRLLSTPLANGCVDIHLLWTVFERLSTKTILTTRECHK